MNKIWDIHTSDTEQAHSLARELQISPVAARLLVSRGITDCVAADQFLHPRLSYLHDPLSLTDCDRACACIDAALRTKTPILVWGDYDVDGVTGTALFVSLLSRLGAEVSYYIPDRIEEGYGIHTGAVEIARQRKVGLVVTVDTGISGNEAVRALREADIDVVVTDHHKVHGDLPEANAVVNPWRPDCAYPFKDLAGVAVAFKVMQALMGPDESLWEDALDLVGLGTIADIVPLVDENRVLASYGLRALTDSARYGVRALCDVAGLGKKSISAYHIGFVLGPRINASGRIGSSSLGCELFVTNKASRAHEVAAILHDENKSRQQIEAKMCKEAFAQVERDINVDEGTVIVVHNDDWHPGVVGIVASRLVDKFFRPALVLTSRGDEVKGSGRSIPGFHLFDAVKSCESLLKDFGGHKHAVGVTLEKGRLGAFTEAITDYARQHLTAEALVPRVTIDAEVNLSDITEALIADLDQLEPFGIANPKPVFAGKGLRLKGEVKRIGKKGFKAWLTDDERVFEAVDFNGTTGIDAVPPGSKCDIVFSPGINSWQGRESINLYLKDVEIE